MESRIADQPATDMPISVMILAGGLSHERDVSLRSGRRVLETLRSIGVDAQVCDVDSNLLSSLAQVKPDLVWPLLHGAHGEDGSLRDILEVLGLPYVGTRPQASRIAWDKSTAKAIVSGAGIATPHAVTLPQSLFRELGAQSVLASVVDRLGLPLVVKPSRGGSALGVSIVRDTHDLPQAMVECFAYGDVALIEQYIEGVEVTVSVVDQGAGPESLSAVEIVCDGPYDYDARYNPGRAEYFTPARLMPEQHLQVQQLALAAHQVLRLRSLSRTDIIVDDQGTPWFLEVNVAPGMTETSLLPQAARTDGYDLAELYRRIATVALTQD